MRLQRLEINGFKSFSDRSELAFDTGVTAIVGPNGCGKSNVADAITWVIGEQSAKSLRGERMEDVIFSGSDGRKPTAAAEVRLRFSGVVKQLSGPSFGDEAGHASGANRNGNGHGHLDNADGNENGNGNGHHPAPVTRALAEEMSQSVAREVEVTRRLYRSGESEYLIDGRVCRLRDVHELLMDTGLGAKAYAIIEQGKIGMILEHASNRPAAAHRGGGRRHEVQGAATLGRAEAGGGAAEPHAGRRHRLRGGEAARNPEAPGGKARRYQRLRDELRRWEKVLFARRHRQLAEAIESARSGCRARREGRGGSGRGARVRGGRSTWAGSASSWSRAESRATTEPRSGPRARAGNHPSASSRSRSTASRSRRPWRRARDGGRARLGARGAAGAGAGRRSPSAAARRRGRGERARQAAEPWPHRWPPTMRRTGNSRGSRRR